jgi:hypothetical protein
MADVRRTGHSAISDFLLKEVIWCSPADHWLTYSGAWVELEAVWYSVSKSIRLSGFLESPTTYTSDAHQSP